MNKMKRKRYTRKKLQMQRDQGKEERVSKRSLRLHDDDDGCVVGMMMMMLLEFKVFIRFDLFYNIITSNSSYVILLFLCFSSINATTILYLFIPNFRTLLIQLSCFFIYIFFCFLYLNYYMHCLSVL
jgi:hypothetical protein